MTPSGSLQELHASCGANHDHAASYADAGLRRALRTAVFVLASTATDAYRRRP
jgi:hypothetical protein